MIQLEGICLRAGNFEVSDVNLSVAPGRYMVLLGPTGSGKSLLLKSICGLLRCTAGAIRIDGRDVTHIEPRLRQVGYVPQDAGLFPHMNVTQNITFPLRARGQTRHQALEQVQPLIEMLCLQPLLDRSIFGLSGGERQKVAVAALASKPKLLLLDEPVSALDGPTRRHLCDELVRLQRHLDVATIHVCHNLDEAMTVGRSAGIMHLGRLVQTGTMDELLAHPRDENVARLLGGENFLSGPAQMDSRGVSHVSLAGVRIDLPERCTGLVRMTIRPECLRVVAGPAAGANQVPATVEKIENRGAYYRVEMISRPEALRFVAHAPMRDIVGRLEQGQPCAVEIPANAIHVFGREGSPGR